MSFHTTGSSDDKGISSAEVDSSGTALAKKADTGADAVQNDTSARVHGVIAVPPEREVASFSTGVPPESADTGENDHEDATKVSASPQMSPNLSDTREDSASVARENDSFCEDKETSLPSHVTGNTLQGIMSSNADQGRGTLNAEERRSTDINVDKSIVSAQVRGEEQGESDVKAAKVCTASHIQHKNEASTSTSTAQADRRHDSDLNQTSPNVKESEGAIAHSANRDVPVNSSGDNSFQRNNSSGALDVSNDIRKLPEKALVDAPKESLSGPRRGESVSSARQIESTGKHKTDTKPTTVKSSEQSEEIRSSADLVTTTSKVAGPATTGDTAIGASSVVNATVKSQEDSAAETNEGLSGRTRKHTRSDERGNDPLGSISVEDPSQTKRRRVELPLDTSTRAYARTTNLTQQDTSIPPKISHALKSNFPAVEDVKIRLYEMGSRVHRGNGPERRFADYWEALSRVIGFRLQRGLGSSQSSLDEAHKVLGSFLRTKQMRRLHNLLILGKFCRRRSPTKIVYANKSPRVFLVRADGTVYKRPCHGA